MQLKWKYKNRSVKWNDVPIEIALKYSASIKQKTEC